KFDNEGNLIWTRTWGGEYWEAGEDLAIDQSGNIYVAGYFNETVDFDPGVGVMEYSSNGDWDSYLVKYDTDGNCLWAKAWGAPMWDTALGVAESGGNVYAVGFFRGGCDFDPGVGSKFLDFVPGASYLTAFDSEGNHLWVKAWAGNGGYDDLANGVDANASGSIFVTGVFDGKVDLDPGGGKTEFTAPTVYQDAYLSCFDPNGDFQWGYGGGEDSDDWGYAVTTGSSGYVFATGDFAGTVDFDPGAGVDNHTSVGERDVYCTCFDAGGVFQWARTWGSASGNWSNGDAGYGVGSDIWGNVLVTGYFNDSVDFDPGPDVDERVSKGDGDIFVNALDSSGAHQWTVALGGVANDIGKAIASDSEGNTFVTGYFSGIADFNPYDEDYLLSSNGGFDCFMQKILPFGQW
ncbi:MAG: hypothetical protein ABIC40_02180, partial [bacterium]